MIRTLLLLVLFYLKKSTTQCWVLVLKIVFGRFKFEPSNEKKFCNGVALPNIQSKKCLILTWNGCP